MGLRGFLAAFLGTVVVALLLAGGRGRPGDAAAARTDPPAAPTPEARAPSGEGRGGAVQGVGSPEVVPARWDRRQDPGAAGQGWQAAPLWDVEGLTGAQVAIVGTLEPALDPAGRAAVACVEAWVRRRPVNVEALEVELERLFVPEGRSVRLLGARVRYTSDDDPALTACLEHAHLGLPPVAWPEGEAVPEAFRLPYAMKRWGLEEVPREGWAVSAHQDPAGLADCVPPADADPHGGPCEGPADCPKVCCACLDGPGYVSLGGCFDGRCVPPEETCIRAPEAAFAACAAEP